MVESRFLTPEQARHIRDQFGTPVYVYDERTLVGNARAALAFPNAFGLTVRYAMKASPNAAILKLFRGLGLHIDASSGFEVQRAMRAGFEGCEISLSSQEWFDDFEELYHKGVKFNACSLNQLRRYGQMFPGKSVGVRFNPGHGSGGTGKTNVGGPGSSFGIWHEWLPEVQEIVREHQLIVERIHTHIGSGSDPAVWQKVADLSLGLVRQFPTVTTLNLGGGYKIGRMPYEKTTDLQEIGQPVREAFVRLADETGRQIHLEIEPGTWLVGNGCCILSTARDVVSTGNSGHQFIKSDTGMTEILRPSLYAAQHPITVFPESPETTTSDYVVVGHCCESGDLLTPSPEDAEALAPRTLATTRPGDLLVIDGAGAYCSGMSAKNYNSFPEAAEVLLQPDGSPRLIRRRQTLDQILQNEV